MASAFQAVELASQAVDIPGAADIQAEVIPAAEVTRVAADIREVLRAVADIPTILEIILVAGSSPSTSLFVGKLCRYNRR